MRLNIIRLGRMDYGEALDIQEKFVARRQQSDIGDVLLLVEHNPVITVGKSGKQSNIIATREMLESNGVSIFEVSRGGDVTYHGPGQIVGYPIIDLSCHGKDIKDFISKLEEGFIRLLQAEYGIAAYREDGKYTGVWVQDEKITAIGIAVKRWVTMHGFAFNVNTNLDHFSWINPCGITDKGVTSLQKLTGQTHEFDRLNEKVIHYFCEVFGYEPCISNMNVIHSIEGTNEKT